MTMTDTSLSWSDRLRFRLIKWLARDDCVIMNAQGQGRRPLVQIREGQRVLLSNANYFTIHLDDERSRQVIDWAAPDDPVPPPGLRHITIDPHPSLRG